MILLFLEQFAPSCAVHARTRCEDFPDVTRLAGGGIEIPKMFDALGPQLNTLMSVRILFLLFLSQAASA